MNDMISDIACMAHCNLLLYSVGEEVSTLQDLIILRQKTKTTVFFFCNQLVSAFEPFKQSKLPVLFPLSILMQSYLHLLL